MFIQLNEATNHTVHVSNHGALSTFIALSEALKGGFIMTYIYIYIYIVRTSGKAIIGMALRATKSIFNKNERKCRDVETKKICKLGRGGTSTGG